MKAIRRWARQVDSAPWTSLVESVLLRKALRLTSPSSAPRISEEISVCTLAKLTIDLARVC